MPWFRLVPAKQVRSGPRRTYAAPRFFNHEQGTVTNGSQRASPGGLRLHVPGGSMLGLVRQTDRVILVGSALAFAAFAGWGSFAYTAVGYGQRVSVLTAERDSALAEAQRLQTTVGELSEVEARLGSARLEYNRVVQSWADVKGRVVATQQELAQLA